MSNIDVYVQKLCPEGVVYKKLREIVSYKDGAAHESIMSDSGKYVVAKVKFISSNGDFRKYADVRLSPVEKNDVIMVMSDLPNGKSLAKCYIIDKDSTYTINQRVCAFTANSEIIDPRFLYYALNRNKQLLKYDSGYTQTHLKKQWILDVEIPVPPLTVQREIVGILDMLAELPRKLKAEIEAREKQYQHYQGVLLSFESKIPSRKMGECCHLEKGQTPIQKAIPGKYPLVVTTAKRKTASNFQFNAPSVCIPLVSSRGHGVASINQVFYQEGKFALGNILCGVTPIDPSVLDAEFLCYYLNYKKDILLVPLMKGGANVSLTVNDLKSVKIPIPPHAEQRKIVEMLKPFEALRCSLLEEMEARQLQFEYYREKLLNFRKV